jgi:ubiquinone/menaquinone biosynthesis C-methylase UbiE
MTTSKEFLRKNVFIEASSFFNNIDSCTSEYLENVINIWHCEDDNTEGRWEQIEQFNAPENKKILDLASGVGTFVLHGLNRGHNIYGVEPSDWKQEYLKIKIKEKNYPDWYLDRFIKGIGENLPFDDNTFDFITSYQTLEHVQDVNKCLREIFRVLKPGGQLWLRAPDYDCWYEPHYLIPFFPKMNKKLARFYLKLLGRPVAGLSTIQWTTTKKVCDILSKPDFYPTSVVDISKNRRTREINEFSIKYDFPHYLSRIIIKLLECKVMFKREVHINLLITKN